MPVIDGQYVTVAPAGGSIGGSSVVGGSTTSANAIGDSSKAGSFFSKIGNFFSGDCSLWKIIAIAFVLLFILKRR